MVSPEYHMLNFSIKIVMQPDSQISYIIGRADLNMAGQKEYVVGSYKPREDGLILMTLGRTATRVAEPATPCDLGLGNALPVMSTNSKPVYNLLEVSIYELR